jgi:hypothetical protein
MALKSNLPLYYLINSIYKKISAKTLGFFVANQLPLRLTPTQHERRHKT